MTRFEIHLEKSIRAKGGPSLRFSLHNPSFVRQNPLINPLCCLFLSLHLLPWSEQAFSSKLASTPQRFRFSLTVSLKRKVHSTSTFWDSNPRAGSSSGLASDGDSDGRRHSYGACGIAVSGHFEDPLPQVLFDFSSASCCPTLCNSPL